MQLRLVTVTLSDVYICDAMFCSSSLRNFQDYAQKPLRHCTFTNSAAGLEVDSKTGGADGAEGEQVDEGGGGGGGGGEKDVRPRPTPMAAWPAKEENKGAFKGTLACD